MIYFGKTLLNIKSPYRAGVIPFCCVNKQLYFLLGIDRKTREYTDFGGGCKQSETFIDTAWRELMEESCEIFNHMKKECLLNSVAVTDLDKTNAIFFLQIDKSWLETAEQAFTTNQKKLNVKKYSENIGVKWICEADFKKIVYDKKSHCVWKKIQNFFMDNISFTHLKLYLLLIGQLSHLFTEKQSKKLALLEKILNSKT